MKGSGSPFTGIRPDVIPQFTNRCVANMVDIPTSINPENLSDAVNASLSIFIIIQINKINMARRVINPNSSPITLTIKSDS